MKLDHVLPRPRHAREESKGKERRSAHQGGDSATNLIGRHDEAFVDLDADREMMEGIEASHVTEKKVDQNFYNKFEDDFDENDMKLA